MDIVLSTFVSTALAMGILFYLVIGSVAGSGSRLWYAIAVGVCSGALLSLAVGSFGALDRMYDSQEISTGGYRKMREVAASDPRLKRMVAKAMSDGRIDNGEYRLLMEGREEAYDHREAEAIKSEISKP